MSRRGERRKSKPQETAGDPPENGDPTAGEKERGGWKENLRSLGTAVVIFVLLRLFVLDTFYITSGSMEESLLVGDFLVVNDAAIGTRIPFTSIHIPGYSEPQRGDILVFDPPHEENMKLVKRLIGLPGDTVEMRDRVLFVNGERLDEPYVKSSGLSDSSDPWMRWQAGYLAPGVDALAYRPTRDTWGPLVIPEDRYFMLGDNRDNSLDSRYWGLLEGWRLEGRVSFIYFSYNSQSFRPFPFIREIRWGRLFNRPS